MKQRLLVIISVVLGFQYAEGAHLELSATKKFEFISKRLAMMKERSLDKKAQLVLLEQRFRTTPSSKNANKARLRIARLKNEIIQLGKNIPVAERSLKALRSLIAL